MRGDGGRFTRPFGNIGVFAAVAFVVVAAGSLLGFAPSAQALPSYARQTGQPCGACHTDFPALTPFGREFKLGGYTLGGGKYQTTIFPSEDDAPKSPAPIATKAAPGAASNGQTNSVWVPPISVMTVVGFTSTQA